jgi:pyrroloquinoline-quinone synthase
MNAGELSPEAIRTWVTNRFYYQKNIPLKDAAILSNCPLREVRRIWLHRISDHDGQRGDEGGIEAWFRLARACGVDQAQLEADPLPGVRFAVDAYVHFARATSWPVAIAASLTEMFAPDLMAQRLAAFQRYYPWVPEWGVEYFRRRLVQAPTDSQETLAITLRWCDSDELKRAAIEALRFKCDVLWSMLDAIDAGTR